MIQFCFEILTGDGGPFGIALLDKPSLLIGGISLVVLVFKVSYFVSVFAEAALVSDTDFLAEVALFFVSVVFAALFGALLVAPIV